MCRAGLTPINILHAPTLRAVGRELAGDLDTWGLPPSVPQSDTALSLCFPFHPLVRFSAAWGKDRLFLLAVEDPAQQGQVCVD